MGRASPMTCMLVAIRPSADDEAGADALRPCRCGRWTGCITTDLRADAASCSVVLRLVVGSKKGGGKEEPKGGKEEAREAA